NTPYNELVSNAAMAIAVEDFKAALFTRLDQLKSDIQLAQREIEDRQALVKDKQEQVEHVISLLNAEGVSIDRTDLGGTVPVSLAEVLVKVMSGQARRPLHYKALTQLVEDTGYKIGGQNPQATVIALLHRKSDQFVRLGQGTWGLVEWGLLSGVSHSPKRRR